MSDPMTNVEIEDVLSSIRRLVSDGERARHRDPNSSEAVPRSATQQDVERDEAATSVSADARAETDMDQADRYVLTPALMVPAAPEPSAPVDPQDTVPAAETVLEEAADAADDPVDPDTEWVEEPWESASSSDEDPGGAVETEGHNQAEATTQNAEWTTDEAWDFDPDQATDETHGADLSDEDDAPMPLTEMIWETDAASSPRTERADPEPVDRTDLAATIAELEAAVGAGTEEFEPDGSELAETETPDTIPWPGQIARAPLNARPADPALSVSDDIEEADVDQARSDLAEAASSDEDLAQDTGWDNLPDFDEPADILEPAQSAVVDDAPDDSDVQTDTAVLETKDEVLTGQPEDEASETDEVDDVDVSFVHSARGSERLTEPALVAGGPAAHEDTAAASDEILDDDPDLPEAALLLDDAALREMVADVVKQELTGPLGERITRNVRKLVRREIYRILSSQEFD